MEDCMIEEPCRVCYRVVCNCPPEPEEPEFAGGTPECLEMCWQVCEHVVGCPHGPDYDVPYEWEPDLKGPTGAERHHAEYKEKYL